MDVLTYQCPNCGAALTFNEATQHWDCKYCLSSFTLEDLEKDGQKQEPEKTAPASDVENTVEEPEQGEMREYTCPQCGAHIVTDATTAASFCVFCGNATIFPEQLSGSFRPELLIPFQVKKDAAQAAFKRLCKGKPLLPGDFCAPDRIEKITGVRPAFEQVDLRDKAATEAVFAKYPDIQGIIHFAASKAVGESVQKPLLYYRNNIVSLINLLELMPKYDVKGIIFSSSCTVYGQPKPENLPVTEDAPHQKATSPYGNTKEINEQIIADYIHSGASIKSIVLRYFNPIGAHPSAEIGELPNGVPNNLIPFVTQTAIGIRKELTIFGNDYNTPDGTCIRDYIYVVDLAKAHVAAMARVLDKETEPIEYFNIGTGNGNSTLEIVETFEKATGVKLNWKYGPRREGDIEKIWGDCSKANKVLGWKAESNLADVLASAWKWQLKLREDGVM